MAKHATLAAFAMALLATLASAGGALALDDATYNFASVQTSKRIEAAPGREAGAAIYFYNVDGNRTTHLNLRVSRAPEGWEVRVEPAERTVRVDVGGRLIEVVQNLHMEPTPLLAEPASDVPEGAVAIEVGERGYAVARVARVVVRAPESATPGDEGEIRVSADAFWPGQSGTADIRQERDFDFVAEVVPGGGAIPRVVPDGVPEEAGAGAGLAALLERWMPTILALVIVVIGAIVIPTLTARTLRGPRERRGGEGEIPDRRDNGE